MSDLRSAKPDEADRNPFVCRQPSMSGSILPAAGLICGILVAGGLLFHALFGWRVIVWLVDLTLHYPAIVAMPGVAITLAVSCGGRR